MAQRLIVLSFSDMAGLLKGKHVETHLKDESGLEIQISSDLTPADIASGEVAALLAAARNVRDQMKAALQRRIESGEQRGGGGQDIPYIDLVDAIAALETKIKTGNFFPAESQPQSEEYRKTHCPKCLSQHAVDIPCPPSL